MPPPIPPPSPRHLLPPLLATLPAAAVSSEPPTALLPNLTPILRQRVQLLSASAKTPWLPLLCYNVEKTGKLTQIAKSDRFEPHPVSGEVEIDWDSEVFTRYKRLDEETLEANVALLQFELGVKLLYCLGDQEGGGDGWRIGEVTVLDTSLPRGSDSHGWESIGEAEGRFEESAARESSSRASDNAKSSYNTNGINGNTKSVGQADDEDDDDAYWAQYDNTPARTPAPKHSPAPDAMRSDRQTHVDAEAAYYAQYSQVQPAMDSHDPDEASASGPVESTLNHSTLTPNDSLYHRTLPHPDEPEELSESPRVWSESALSPHVESLTPSYEDSKSDCDVHDEDNNILVQPRPTSSSSSSSSATVAKLEHTAASQQQSEIGVRQHISTSIKSLFRLARAAGMERGEFDRLVRTELEVLGLLEEDD